jgi:hypothetical protein
MVYCSQLHYMESCPAVQAPRPAQPLRSRQPHLTHLLQAPSGLLGLGLRSSHRHAVAQLRQQPSNNMMKGCQVGMGRRHRKVDGEWHLAMVGLLIRVTSTQGAMGRSAAGL